jgi:hypothetical protein
MRNLISIRWRNGWKCSSFNAVKKQRCLVLRTLAGCEKPDSVADLSALWNEFNKRQTNVGYEKKAFLIGCFCSFFFGALAQNDHNSLMNKPNTILIAPLNLFDVVNPSVQIGYERVLNNHFSAQIEAGAIMNHSITNYVIDRVSGTKDCPYTSAGYKIRTEVKYFIKEKSFYKPYIAVELFFMKNRSRVQDLFEVGDSTFQYPFKIRPEINQYYDFFTLNKRKIGLNMKFGWKFPLFNQFILEPYIGIGIAYRNSIHENRINPLDKQVFDDYFNDCLQGSSWLFSMPLNVKVGYRF